jgi:putative sterol carrier protein
VPPPYLFLSDDWVTEARRIREQHAGGGIAVPSVVKLNQVITEVPFREEPVKAHLDTSSGELVMELGHVETPDVTITLDYETAKAIFVDGTAQAGMAAFMAGKIKVEGDLAKLIAALQQVNPSAFEASEVQRRIKEITVLEDPAAAAAAAEASADQGPSGEVDVD